MSKLRIEHGASKITLVQIKANIEASISNDIDLLAEWSDNDRRYVINELLRFALTQNEEFLKFKAVREAKQAALAGNAKAISPSSKSVSETTSKPTAAVPSVAVKQ